MSEIKLFLLLNLEEGVISLIMAATSTNALSRIVINVCEALDLARLFLAAFAALAPR